MSAERILQTRRLFEEYATLAYLLLGDLRSALDDFPEDTSRSWLVAVMDALLEALPRELELCGAIESLRRDGLLNATEDAGPFLETIRVAHGELLDALATLRRRTDAAPGHLLDDALRIELSTWVEQVHEHNRRHAELRLWLQPVEEPPRRRRRTRP